MIAQKKNTSEVYFLSHSSSLLHAYNLKGHMQ